jgi:hypothetical protein
MGHLSPTRDVGRVMAFLHPQNALKGKFEHKQNLVFPVVILLLGGEKFFLHKEDVLVPVLGVPMKETLYSCPSSLLQSRSKEVSF